MKLSVSRPNLLSALNLASGVIKRNTPKPLLSCVRLSATSDALTIASTDLELSLISRVTTVADVTEGETAVSAEDLRSLIASCEGDAVAMELNGDTFHIRSGGNHFTLYAMKPTDFPPSPAVEGAPTFTLTGQQVERAVAGTMFAVGLTTDRYAMAGELVEAKKGRVAFVATDGKRLACVKVAAATTDDNSVIAPERAVSLAAKLADAAGIDATVEFYLGERSFGVRAGDALMVSNIIEGGFPPYEDVIPKESSFRTTVDAKQLAAAVKRAALLTTEESKGVVFEFEAGKGLILSARSPERGQSTVQFPCKFEGGNLKIGMNPSYAAEAARAVGGDGDVMVEFTAPNRPALFSSGSDALCVVMPVNLS